MFSWHPGQSAISWVHFDILSSWFFPRDLSLLFFVLFQMAWRTRCQNICRRKLRTVSALWILVLYNLRNLIFLPSLDAFLTVDNFLHFQSKKVSSAIRVWPCSLWWTCWKCTNFSTYQKKVTISEPSRFTCLRINRPLFDYSLTWNWRFLQFLSCLNEWSRVQATD